MTRPTSTRFAAPALWLLAALLLGGPARGGNPIVNGHFHANVANWVVPPGFTSTAVSRSPLDANGAASSGSMRLRNTGIGGFVVARVAQCVSATAGEYTLSSRYRVPAGQVAASAAIIHTFTPFASGGCTGSPLGEPSTGANLTTTNQWLELTTTFTPPAGVHSLLIGFNTNVSGGGGSFDVFIDDVFLIPSACGASTLCLRGDRFVLVADWRTDTGSSGQAGVVQLTPETGYFWFFEATNVELVTKVLNACALSPQRFWVFTAGLTNQQVVLAVLDKTHQKTRIYANPQGTDFQPRYDTNAFATCP